ncbi:hypothetical protein SAMN06265379_1061, partial [Saccharicrinis carchari]
MRNIYTFLVVVLLLLGAVRSQAQNTYYTLASGDWHNADIWTLDPAGAIPVGSAVPMAGDNVVIKSGKVVTVQVTDPLTTMDLGTVTIEGSLKLGTTTNHKMNTLRGSGKIFIQGNNFPTVSDASHFITKGKGEGTVVLEGNSFTYGSGATDTFYSLEVNTNAGQTVTLLNNLKLNGNLNILQGTLQVNDGSNTSPLTLDVAKDIAVQAKGGMTVGTANAIHRINASGDFKNHGSIDFTNAAQYTAASNGAVNVNFTGNSDNELLCNGITTFYRMFLNKGTDRTYTLAVSANNATNFSLDGPISGASGIEPTDGPAGWQRLALVLNSGTLKLESNIDIPRLGANRNGSSPNEFHIPASAQLWINGATVATHESGGGWRGITVYGKLKVSSGSFTNPAGTGGITYFSNADNPGTLEISGGDVYTTQLKQSDASGKFNYIQSGGTMHINSLADGRGSSAIFALPGTDDYFEMTGGQIVIDAVNTAATNGIDIGATSGNYNVTGGTIQIKTPTLGAGTAFQINSTAPFYNLRLTNSARGGSQAVALQSELTVLNDLDIAANTTLNAASHTLEIRGDFTNNGTYTTGTNTTRFIGANPSIITGNLNFSTLELKKEAETQTVTLGAGAINITGDLTISKGTLDVGSIERNLGGNIDISYGGISGASALVLNSSSAQQTLKGKLGQNPGFGKLILNNSYGTAPQIKLLSDVDATSVEFQRDLIFDLEGYNINISNSTYSGADANWGATRLFRTSGLASDGGLTLSVNQNDNGTDIQFFPIGVNEGGTTRYTPMQADANAVLSANGTITVRPVNDYHPTNTNPSPELALPFYWKVTQKGLSTEENKIRYQFTYYSNFNWWLTRLGATNCSFSNYKWNDYSTDVRNRTIRFPYNSFLETDFTFAKIEGFFYDPPRTLYSKTNGAFNGGNTWTTNPNHSTGSASAPQKNDYCIIASGDTVTIDANNADASQIQIEGALIVNAGKTGHDIDLIKGSGTIRYNGNNLINGDHSEFCNNPNAIFEFSGGQYELPASIYKYPNLHITGSGRKTTADVDLLVAGDLVIDGADLDLNTGTNGDMEILGNLNIQSNRIRFRRMGNERTVSVGGDIITSTTGDIVAQNAGSVSLEHKIKLDGNINHSGRRFRMYKVEGTQTNSITFYFQGLENATVATPAEEAQFSKIVVDKPVGKKVTFVNDFTLRWPADKAIKPLSLISGECHLNNSAININLSTGGKDFRIPSGTTLKVDGGASVNVGGAASNTGIWLDGALIVDNNGTVNCNQGANGFTDNYIAYSSSGEATIWLGNNAQLNIGSQIRRSLKTDVGLLNFNQNDETATVTVGMNDAGDTSRGVFEIMGAGSSFTQAQNARITIARGHGAGYRSLWFDPETVNLSTGSGFVIGHDTHTPASQEVGIYAAQPFNNLSINATNTPKATLMVLPLNLQESLAIGTGAELDAAGLDVSVKGDFNNAGTYTANNNTTYLDGTNDQTIRGASTFYNLVKQTSNTLNLASNIDVANNLSLLAGTLNTDIHNMHVQGNLLNNATTVSSGTALGIVMNSIADQQELSGTGVFSRLCIDNARGVVMPTQSAAIEISDMLTLEDGVFDIGRNLMVLTPTASFSPGTTHGGYTSANMVQTNLSFSDAGIRKDFPSTAGGSFTYPLGSFGKYTPVSFTNLNYAAGTGSIRVKAANEAHLSALDINNVLQYNWTLDAQGINGFTADVTMICDPADIALNGHVVEDYVTAQYALVSDTVYKFNVDDFVEPNTLTYQFALATDADIDGDYSAGIPAAIPDKVPSYITVANGDWQTQRIWATYDPATSTTGAAGVGVPVLGPRGSAVHIRHEISLSRNGEAAAYRTILQPSGVLKTGATFAHRFGEVSGSGTLVLESGDMPAGVYDEFFSSNGGTLEFTGSMKNYDILSEVTQLNNLTISGSGTRNFPNLHVQLFGDLMIDGPDVDNEYNKTLSVGGDIYFNGGTYSARSGSFVLNGSSHQTVGGTTDFTSSGGGALYNLTINNSAKARLKNNIEVSNKLNLSSGVLSTKDGGSLTITNASSSAVVGGSTSSYVEGPLRKKINNLQSFTFPVGDNTRYGQIGVSVAPLSGGIWEATYHSTNPGNDGFDPNALSGLLKYVSHNEYWQIKAPNKNCSANMSLRWDDASGVIPDLNFRVAQWDGISWSSVPIDLLQILTRTVRLQNNMSFSPGSNKYLTFSSISIPEFDWLGGSSDWFDPGNWAQAILPGGGTDITITNTGVAPVISDAGLAQVNDLIIEADASLTLNPGAKLTVNGNLTTNDKLTVKNTPSKPSSLITYGTVSGQTNYEWSIPKSLEWYMSHPVRGVTEQEYEASY